MLNLSFFAGSQHDPLGSWIGLINSGLFLDVSMKDLFDSCS